MHFKGVKRQFFIKLKVMKTIIASFLVLLTAVWSTVSAQDWPEEYLGLPGDNLNLYAVMQLFQESETLEEFERKLNTQDTRVNNLDLNGDNLIDYITVSDYVDGNVHNIALRVAMGRNDLQDVAVFVVQELANGQVHIQLIGDEDLYGRNYIVEPNYDQYYGETRNPGYTGNARNVTVIRTNTYEVATWPVIRFIYNPGYVAWRSSWYWGYYPSYWVSWRPYYWHFYYGYHSHWYPHYYSHYRYAHHVHYNRYRDFYYTSHRHYSPTVKIKIKEGNYRVTYARPDQRKAGERLYSRTVANDRSRVRSTSAATRSSVSSSTARGQRQESLRSASDRRSTSGVSTRSASSGQVQRSTSATSRGQRQESVRSASDRRATTSVGTRSASNGQVQRNSANTTRRTESVTQRPSSNNSRGAERVNSETSRPGTSFGQPSATTGRSTVDRTGASNRNGSVQNKSATRSGSSAVQQRPSTRQGNSTISSGRSGSQVERSPRPAVNQTKSASRSSSPAVNQTKSASRSSSPSVSRSSSSRSSDTKVSTPRSQSRSNSSVSSGRTESKPSSSGSRSSSGSSNSSRSSDNSKSRR